MSPVKNWPPLTPLDWIWISSRWLWLAALPLVAGLRGRLTFPLVFLNLAWLGFALAMSLARMARPLTVRGVYLAASVDVVFAVAAIALTGSASSPLWWCLLVSVLGVALMQGLRRAVLVAAAAGAAAVGMLWLQSGSSVLGPGTGLATAVVVAGAGLGWVADRARRAAVEVGQEQGVALREIHQRERVQVGRFFDLSSQMSSALDHERVLDLALELTAHSLEDDRGHPDDLVGLLLLRAGDRLRIVSGRGLQPGDWRLDFGAGRGLMGRTLTQSRPTTQEGVGRDPELKRLSALEKCRSVVGLPLGSGEAALGLLLFGHPEPGYFQAERIDLLEAMGRQIVIALHNARRFQDLVRERDRITELQEEARRGLARDLHDGPIQTMATIAMRASYIRRLMSRDKQAAAQELRKVEELARMTTREVRHMLFTLRPLLLESQGLVMALQQLTDKTSELSGVEVRVEASPDVADGLPAGVQSAVFYIAEEAVNNARKHAEAEHILVRLSREPGGLVLEVEDDGVGFNVGAVDAGYEQRGSLGMVTMRERSELVGGTLRIESVEGKGTRVRLTVPRPEGAGVAPEAG
ncbi:MAG TPA: GAF domain-containing sensor histidine kinase [Anaerolineales bacterium]|nr:GAF domain-containing sensor histidine kinase [Anaerolineales bacterium]